MSSNYCVLHFWPLTSILFSCIFKSSHCKQLAKTNGNTNNLFKEAIDPSSEQHFQLCALLSLITFKFCSVNLIPLNNNTDMFRFLMKMRPQHKKQRTICANPNEDWVQDLMVNVDRRNQKQN